ncbi:MAG: FAD-binding oxidoreductase [Chloroflexi bacterium]|nr:FAD-binding oxidoreductase [Chloroflexota bacterium]
MPSYDAIVIGAGYIGCSVAYHLTKAGLKTALFDQGGIAAGASRANYGNYQVQDAELEHSLPMITAGYRCFDALEEELDCRVGLRTLGGLLLIETESQWQTMASRLPQLHAAGIQAELVPSGQLPELEPLLNPRTVVGACYHEREGQVYPFSLTSAYVRRALERGLSLHLNTKLKSIGTRSGRIHHLETSTDTFDTAVVVLCTGAWTMPLGLSLGQTWSIPHVHGQALVTESVPGLRLQNHIASAAFFEDMHVDDAEGERAVLAVSQATSGHFLLGEAPKNTTDRGSEATPEAQAAIAKLVGHYFPALKGLRVLRGWGAPVAYTNDGLPYLGPVSDIEGLILATAFKSTVIVTPLVGRTIAQLVIDRRTDLDITPFSPDRVLAHVH